MNKYLLTQSIKVTMPVFFGYIAIGIPFGLMCVTAGYPWWLAFVMSVFIYGGTAQYAAIGLFASGASLSLIIFTEFFINIRHIVYGLSLITKFSTAKKWKPYLIFALTDETYALVSGCAVPKGANSAAFYGMVALLDQSYWVLGSVIGALAGTLIPFDFAGVDFALTALFAVILVDQIRNSKDIVPPIIGIITTALCIVISKLGLFPSTNILITSICVSIIVLGIAKRNKLKEEVK